MKGSIPIFFAAIAAGWLVPLVVWGWFEFISKPADSEDYGWGIGAFLAILASFVVALPLMSLGVWGLARSKSTTIGTKIVICMGMLGLLLASTFLLLLFVT